MFAYLLLKHGVNCRCAGIETTQVEGYVKHSEYQPGDNAGSEKFKSIWTAILINDTWHLADVHWSSKHVSGMDPGEWILLDYNGKGPADVKKEKREINYKYNEFYFLTNPEHFIYSHFPKELEWQLLARPVSLKEFTEMVKLDSQFFEYQLRLDSHRRCVESAPDGFIKIDLRVPPNTEYEFMYHLWMSTKGKEDASKYKDKELKQFVFMEANDGTLSCRIEFPVAGKFKLELFCTDKTVSDTYFRVCTYVINAEKAKKDATHYPADSRPQWGPSYDLKAAGLTPITHERGMVKLENGEMEMRFGSDKNVDILPKVHSNTRTADSMKGFVIYWYEDKKICLNMKFPEAGIYALNLYAKEKRGEESNLPNVCSYVISAEEPAEDVSPFFITGSGQLGANDNFHKLRMKAISHPSAYVEAPENGQIDFLFSTPVPCDLRVVLFLCRDKKEQKMDGFTFVDKRIDKATVKTRFSEKGNYKLEIYGKEKDKDGSCQLVFVYVVVVSRPMSDCCQFPKTYDCWTDGCELSEPGLGNPLYVYTTVPFAVKIPKAQDVAVVHPADVWTHLTKSGKEMWKGSVDTGSEAGKDIRLCARLSNAPDSFSVMLEFKVRQ